MNVISLDSAKQDLEAVVAKVLADAEPTIVNTADGESIVIVSLEEFNAWRETAYLLQNPANAAHLRQSIAQSQAGKVAPHELCEP
jgi:antitoxin YefM